VTPTTIRASAAISNQIGSDRTGEDFRAELLQPSGVFAERAALNQVGERSGNATP
jgi:hypothetical protein